MGLWFTFCHHTLLIEEPFSKVIIVLKCIKSTLHSDIVDLQTCMAAVIASITPNDCQQCINHCQIYLQLLYFNFGNVLLIKQIAKIKHSYLVTDEFKCHLII